MHVPSCLDSTNNPSIKLGLDLLRPATNTGSTQELAYEFGRPTESTPNVISHYIIYFFMHVEVHRCLDLSRLYSCRAQNKIEGLIPVDPGIIAGESPTCIPHEGVHCVAARRR